MKRSHKNAAALLLTSLSLYANPINTYNWLRPSEYQLRSNGEWTIELQLNTFSGDTVYTSIITKDSLNKIEDPFNYYWDFQKEFPLTDQIVLFNNENVNNISFTDTLVLVITSLGDNFTRIYTLPPHVSDSSSYVFYNSENFIETEEPTLGTLNPPIQYHITGRAVESNTSNSLSDLIVSSYYLRTWSIDPVTRIFYDTTDEEGSFDISFSYDNSKTLNFHDSLTNYTVLKNGIIAHQNHPDPDSIFIFNLPDTVKPMFKYDIGNVFVDIDSSPVSVKKSGKSSAVSMKSVTQKQVFLNVSNMNGVSADLSLYSLKGKRIHSEQINLNSGLISVNLSDIANGAYIMKIEGGAVNQTFPVTLK